VAGEDRVDPFEAFVAAVTPRLRRTARLLTGDPALTEDLLQTVFMKLFVRWGRSAGSWHCPVAYAQRVLYTTFYAWSGRRWNAEVPTASVPEAAQVDAFAGVNTGAVHAALLALPRRQRAVLVARFYDDLSVDQTAALLGCSESNVKSQTARGLERLRTVLPAQPSRVEEA
jgi:RNA polymerase sigma-70 factor (sigma-E family)